jgi:hypothetical protein
MKTKNQFRNEKDPKPASLEISEIKSKTKPIKRAALISISLLFVLLSSLQLQAQNPNAAQWKSVGGQKIMSGKHSFTTSWSSSPESRDKGLYWKGSFYESKPQYSPWDPDVKNSVAPLIGRFAVHGPGHIGLFSKAKGASIVMNIAGTKEVFHPFSIGNNFNPDSEFWGKISADSEVSIDVFAVMGAYNNMMNTGEYAFHAPQEITHYEIWFFPQQGGKVIRAEAPISNKTTETDSNFDKALGNPCGSDKAFVRSLYQSILGRDLDVSFANNARTHLEKLQNGDDRWKIIWNFFHSTEYTNKHKSHKEFIRDAYQSILGREPTKKEFGYWPKVDRGDILRKFFNSDEYHHLLKTCGQQGKSTPFLSIDGNWNLKQDNGYSGSMNIQQSSSGHITGNVIWNGSLKGSIDGDVSAKRVKFTIDYHNGDIGYYNGSLSSDGKKIIDGTTKGNNGVKANWTAVKSNPSSNAPSSTTNKQNNNSVYNEPYIIGTDSHIYYGFQSGWKATPGGGIGKDIAVDTRGHAWVIGNDNTIWYHDGRQWNLYSRNGRGKAIAVSSKGVPWIIGTDSRVYYGSDAGWTEAPGNGLGKDLALDKKGRPWVIGSDNTIWYLDQCSWNQYPGGGRGLAICIDPEGIPWVIGMDNRIYHGSGSGWIENPGGGIGKDIAVDSKGQPWVVGSDNGIYYFNGRNWIQHAGKGKAYRISFSN